MQVKTDNGGTKIRLAGPGDAAAIAKFHVASWIETYTGLLSHKFMDNLMTVEDRTVFWTRALKGRTSLSATFIAINRDQQAVGFISGGPQHLDQFADYEGEIYAIYILRKHQKQGFGRALMVRAVQSFHDHNLSSVSCVVLGKNQQAYQFYEALGGHVIGELIDERPTGPLIEIAYGWNEASALYSKMPTTGAPPVQGETDASR